MRKIIQDYGNTVTPRVYMDALQGHQYISQSDQCIKNITRSLLQKRNSNFTTVLDVGCGPGRLTFDFFANKVYGIDISPSFIQHANTERLNHDRQRYTFYCQDFTTLNSENCGYVANNLHDIIFMQGIMHHIHGDDRAVFLQKSFNLLKPDGLLIIGDEFIRPYRTSEERILNVAKFYLHIIDEARKGGFDDLAREEAKNLIDDCFSGTMYAGYAVKETFKHIYRYAEMINTQFYKYGSAEATHSEMNNQVHNLFRDIKKSVEHLTSKKNSKNFNRGDYKISIEKFVPEVKSHGFRLSKTYKIGPVDQLGGMGVLVFKK